jgi:hypothetical protein
MLGPFTARLDIRHILFRAMENKNFNLYYKHINPLAGVLYFIATLNLGYTWADPEFKQLFVSFFFYGGYILIQSLDEKEWVTKDI